MTSTAIPQAMDGWNRRDDDGSGGNGGGGNGGGGSPFNGAKQIRWTDVLGFHDRDENKIPYGTRLIAFPPDTILQRWENGFANTIYRDPVTGKFPADLDNLNSTIPVEQWETNRFTGRPEKPWQRYARFFFADPVTGERWVHINKTNGTWMAYEALRNKVETLRMLGKLPGLPVIELRSTPWHSRQFGPQLRADFPVVDSYGSTTSGGPTVGTTPAKQIEKPPTPVSHPSDVAPPQAAPPDWSDIPLSEPPSANEEPDYSYGR
jgi:hypothetical protein